MAKSIISENMEKKEQKARVKEYKNEQKKEIFTGDDLTVANILAEKAAAQGMRLVPEKKIKDRTKFVQIFQKNINYLRKEKYLTGAEKVFLFDLSSYVGFRSNCIIRDIEAKEQVAITQSELADELGRHKSNISPLVNSLIDKGILSRADSVVEDNNVRAYSLFVNPNIMFSGSRDEVNKTLEVMFRRANKNKFLKNLPDRFM